jgi:superfamily II DNA helicase RecQ
MQFCWDARTQAVESQEPSNNQSDSSHRAQTYQGQADIEEKLCYLQQYHVLICTEHATGVQNLYTHLRDYHTVTSTEKSRLVEKYRQYRIKRPADIELPPPLGPPICELGEPLDGFQCGKEDCDYITINLDCLRIHCKEKHKLRWSKNRDGLFDQVKVQTFFRTAGLQRYFIVNALSSNAPVSLQQKEEVERLLGEWKTTKQGHEAEAQVMEAEAAKTDRTGWFKRTGWLEHLAERNRVHLAHAIKLPRRDEPKLNRARLVVERLVERSVCGLSSLSRETRRWLKSAQQFEIDQRPLARLQNPESQARYAGYMVMFVCYFLRILADEEARAVESSEESSEESSADSESEYSSNKRLRSPDVMKDARELFRWRGRQKELAQELWLALDGDDENAQMGALLKVLAAFIFEPVNSSVFESGLIHFLAVLGIDAEMDRLRTAKNYSYMLAGMVYCMRVLGVEALLPADERDEQGVEERDHFLLKRREFLADGSYSPMSEMISLLAYGKHIALNAGNSGNVYWSKDKKIFYLHGKPILISQFRRMAQDMVTEAEDMLWQELLWVARPEDRFAIRLDLIRDDVTFTRRGMSFVNHGDNGLDRGLEWMLSRMLENEQGRKLRSSDGAWNLQQVGRYLRQVKRFLELLLVCVHMTSGQPGRGSEVTTMRHRNGVLQDRNMFVIDGLVMTVVRYHKSQSQWDKPKVVPRFLPGRLGQVLVVYLAYLQPFQEYLTVQVLGGSFSDYVWADEQGPWGTDRLTRALRRESGKRLGVELTTLDYRHTAVGIGRVMIGESFGRGYQDEVGEIEEAEVEDDGESPLELQNSRTTQIGIGNYSVPIDIVKHLSVRSIETFRPLSELWHTFLGFHKDEKTRGISPNLQMTINKRGCDSMDERRHEAITPQRKRSQLLDNWEGELQRAMQQALGRSEVSFKSAEQEQAMRAVINGQTPLVVVLPTGGGKSLLFTVPACLQDAGVTLVVVPYRALIEDLVMRITQSGIDCIEWKHGQTNPAAVVAVSADVAGSSSFLSYAGMLSSKKLLRRVVVDECHLIFTSSDWRPKLAKLKHLRVLACPIILLTATLPPVLEEVLGESMLVRCATYIRASTVRPNIRYLVSWCERGKAQEMALAICRRQQRLLRNGKKGVIYCRSKAQCEELAEELDCGYYHAGVVDRAERLQAWLEEGGFIVATSALGTGVDFPGIVLVVHVGMPWSMIDFAQESGRGGRGGELVDSIIVVERAEVERRLQKEEESIDVQAMGMFIQGSGCRRGMMSEYLDGQRVECNDIESAGCDRCGEGVREWQEWQSQHSEGWQRVQKMMDELRVGCSVCWVMGDAAMEVSEEDWRGHRTMQCSRYSGLTGREVDEFRRGLRDGGDCHSCRRCWVSQKYCATGEDVQNRCQWPNVVVPVARAALGIMEGIQVIRECGYKGVIGEDCGEYRIWLGRRHTRRFWGEYFSNAMVVAIQVIEKLV